MTTLSFSRRIGHLHRRPHDRRHRMLLEPLEGRQLLSTLTVTTDDDSGDNNNPTPGSLRAAIVASNNAPVGTVTTIDFNIAPGGAQTIPLVAPLPTLANPTIIDGTTQPGYTGRPLIQVDGTQAGGGAVGFSLDDDSHASTIKGLEITGFSGGGILDDNGNNNTFTNDVIGLHVVTGLPRVVANGTFGIEIRDQANHNTLSNLVVAGNTYNGVVINNSTGTTLTGSFIGTDATETASLDRNGTALGNGVAGGGGSGVVLNGTASNTTISNNVIVNNQSYGVLITDSGTTKNTLVGNKIGVDKTGTTALGNVLDGVAILSGARSNSIGTAGQGNVISGNGHSGVWITGFDNAGPTGLNTVAGNFIGTNAAGSAAIPNALDGVVVNNTAFANTIGTADAGGGNVISGNSQWGVYISDAGTSGNLVQGNFIGTDVTGKAPVPNVNNGVDIVFGAQNNTIGGTTAAARNLISGNLHEGILIGFAGTSNNVVEGNFIGTDVTGKAFLASQQQTDGVYVGLGAGSNTIGGQNPVGTFNTAAWNVISGNSFNGILVTDSGTTGPVISGNFIGTDVTGKAPVPNGGNGVTIAAGTSGTVVGTSGSSAIANLNVISGNLGDGVSITSSSGHAVIFNFIGTDISGQKALPNRGNGLAIHAASGNTVQLDVIRDNAGYGILTDTGSSNNTWFVDSISGNTLGGIAEPTNPSLEPAPVLTRVTVANGQTTVTGTVTGSLAKSTALDIEFFASPAATTPAGAQGLTFIGRTTPTTDANGNVSFTATLPTAVPVGQIITATAGPTSVFSAPVNVVANPTLGDAGFEAPAVGAGQFQTDPSGTPWTFTGTAGIAANGSGFTKGNPNAPEGLQVAFLKRTGSFSQAITLGAGSYRISFQAAQRAGNHQNFSVLVDGKVVGTFTPAGSAYASYSTSTFSVAAGTHTITFKGLDSAGGNNTALVDAVSLTVTPTAGPVGVDLMGQPANLVLGQDIQPALTVLVVDQAGNRVRGSDLAVTISIYSGPAHAKLIGSTTVLAVDGLATFSGLKLSKAGKYRLMVTGPGLTPDISNVFTVTVGRKGGSLRGHRPSTSTGHAALTQAVSRHGQPSRPHKLL